MNRYPISVYFYGTDWQTGLHHYGDHTFDLVGWRESNLDVHTILKGCRWQRLTDAEDGLVFNIGCV